MVDFGLKLEGNKVAEWAEYYIDYEGLKILLEKLAKADKKRNEFLKKEPKLARNIQREFFSNEGRSQSSSVHSTDTKIEHDEYSPLLTEDENDSRSKYDSNTSFGSEAFDEEEQGAATSVSSQHITKSKTSGGGNILAISFHSRFEHQFLRSLREVKSRFEKFRKSFLSELIKVNKFYQQKTGELDARLKHLIETDFFSRAPNAKNIRASNFFMEVREIVRARVTLAGEMNTSNEDDDIGEYRESIRVNESRKRALIDQYRSCKLLCNFAQVNHTGFFKIVKKFKKNHPLGKDRLSVITSENPVSDGHEVDEIADKIEILYANWFTDKNIRVARIELLPKKGDGLQMDWSQVRLGYRMGMCSILAIWVCWDCVWGLVKDGNSTIGGRVAFPVFRACGGLLLVHWFWGLSVWVWRRYRINYIYLFDFDPRIVQNPVAIFNDVVDESLVFLVLMLLYYKSGAHDIPYIIPPSGYAIILVLYTLKVLIFPLKTRIPLWNSVKCVITSPLTSPTFFHTYIADVFTSMVKVFQDLFWTICFIASGAFLVNDDDIEASIQAWKSSYWYKSIAIPIICLLPLWIRFNQCLRRYLDTGKRCPNLPNATKYALSQTVTLFGAFHPLYMMRYSAENNIFQYFWMGLFIASSLYSFFWDVYMDWGLGRPSHGFLGPRLMFPNHLHYFSVMFVDLFLRFMWVLTLIPPNSGAKFEIPNYLSAVTMSLELFRRTIWGFFRLENEHRQNTAGFRSVAFVPLHFDTGHDHKYKEAQGGIGWSVLFEVLAMGIAVIAISASSIISAEHLTHH